jgi:hypothetical protein
MLNYAARHEGVCGSGGVARLLNFDTKFRCVGE